MVYNIFIGEAKDLVVFFFLSYHSLFYTYHSSPIRPHSRIHSITSHSPPCIGRGRGWVLEVVAEAYLQTDGRGVSEIVQGHAVVDSGLEGHMFVEEESIA